MDYKLIIFDADGTLCTTRSGATFRKTADDWKLLPGVEQKIIELDKQGVKLAIATNQGGVAFGYMQPVLCQALLPVLNHSFATN